ncbi:MAG TPA: AMP-binding protein [Terrimesophilobacter sp.]|nr:AMP-binding protein [Terrimesophilobacter sp.]HRP98846.1 AMP-binding protein [Terrimesophilobacter sp.]
MGALQDALQGQWTPISDEVAAARRAAGHWSGQTVRSLLSEAAALAPDNVAVVGRTAEGARHQLTYAELDDAAHRLAASLAALGLKAGDTVAVMLPNGVEYPALAFAINEIGAVYTGIPVAYGERQAAPILERSRASMLVTAKRWRNTDLLGLARSLRAASTSLQNLVIVGADDEQLGEGEHDFDMLPVGERVDHELRADRLCYLGFTSGTTGEPKGAMHNHDTLVYTARAFREHLGDKVLGTPMVQLVASPAGHHTGFVWGILFTTLMRGTAVHVDRWDPSWVAEVMAEEGVTCMFGAPTFLQDLMDTELVRHPESSLTCIVVAGSPIPRGLPEGAGRALGAYICSAWGLTECGIMSATTPLEPDRAIDATDGSIIEGSMVRVTTHDGQIVEAGQVGELWMRGPGVTLGYYDRPAATSAAFDEDLWFATGDTASIDRHGWLTLRGRTKDIVIRGGENVPVTDIESLIVEHPAVRAVAVVGYPDDRLGERVAAVAVLKPGEQLDVSTLGAYLRFRGLSTHYLPEHLRIVDALPMTQSGKIQKHMVREELLAAIRRTV